MAGSYRNLVFCQIKDVQATGRNKSEHIRGLTSAPSWPLRWPLYPYQRGLTTNLHLAMASRATLDRCAIIHSSPEEAACWRVSRTRYIDWETRSLGPAPLIGRPVFALSTNFLWRYSCWMGLSLDWNWTWTNYGGFLKNLMAGNVVFLVMSTKSGVWLGVGQLQKSPLG